MDAVTVQQGTEALDIAHEISQILDTGIDFSPAATLSRTSRHSCCSLVMICRPRQERACHIDCLAGHGCQPRGVRETSAVRCQRSCKSSLEARPCLLDRLLQLSSRSSKEKQQLSGLQRHSTETAFGTLYCPTRNAATLCL